VLFALVGLAVAGAPAPAQAGSTPGFFTGVVERPAVLAGLGGTFDDLGLDATVVWLDWHAGMSAPTDENVATVEGVVASLPGARVVLAAGSTNAHTPLTAEARDDYCSFVRGLLERVPAVRDVIVWNEPNKRAGWNPQFDGDGKPVAAAAYVALLARCWDVLHAFRPDANVVAFALSPSGNDNPNAVSNISRSPAGFIRDAGAAYRASGRAKRIFDTVAQHPYGQSPRQRPWTKVPDTRWVTIGDYDRLMAALRDGFDFPGSGQPVPGQCKDGPCVVVWYTEAGFQTSVPEAHAAAYAGEEATPFVIPDDAGGEPEPPGQFGPDQRTQLEDAIRLSACQPYVQAFFNYLVVDDVDLGGWQSGLLWADGTQKGSYPYARAAIAEAAAGGTDCAALKGGPAPALETTPPARPTGLVARPSPEHVRLSWPLGPDPDVAEYRVDRAEAFGGPWTEVGTTQAGHRSFTDVVENGELLYYALRAVDTAGNVSERSTPVCALATPRTVRYPVAALALRAGRGRTGLAPARVAANDGKRVVVGSGARRRATLEAAVRLPACARAPRALRLELDLSALPGASVAVQARNPRSGAWRTVAKLSAGSRDRLSARPLPAIAAAGGTVRVRLVATGTRPFALRVDLLRLAVS
jgi:hypothetical protein